MTKGKLSLRHVVTLLLPVAASPAAAANADRPFPGQLSSLFRINDADPESSVPTAIERDGNPIEFGYFLQDVSARAEAAQKKDDQQAIIRYYRALAAAIPGHAKGWSLLCEAYEKANDRQRAIGACRYAIDREGVELKDYTRFVHLVVAKRGDLDGDERAALNEVLAHLDKEPNLDIPTAHLRCEAASKMKDQAAMEACTAVLGRAAPNDPKTIVFQWSLAMMRGRQDDARVLLGRAEAAGIAAEAIEQMNGVMAQRRWSPSHRVGAVALATVAAALLLLFLRRRLDARRLGGDVASSPLPRG
jgi:hypothetical protein